MKISVTTLSSYEYCPRKLYLTMVLRKEEPPKDSLVKGTIRHSTYELINKAEEQIIRGIREGDSVLDLYSTQHSRFLKDCISKNRGELKQVGLNPSDIFRDSWPLILAETKSRVANIMFFIQKHKVFGDELWEKLVPKLQSEVRIESERLELKGVVDQIEDYGNEYVPVELKTGKIPDSGVWPSHKVQIGAYAMLIEDKTGISVAKGYVDYLDSAEKVRREVRMNPFLTDDVIELVRKVKILLNASEAPPICENKNKCASCGLLESCTALK